MYATEYRGVLACGSSNALKYAGQPDLWPINSLGTFQFWLGLNQEPSGLGVLLKEGTLTGPVMFCPTDTETDVTAECEKFTSRSTENAWCSYLYRQLDAQASSPAKRNLAMLGKNAQGKRVTALILDIQATMDWIGLPKKKLHDGVKCNIGFADGSVITVRNKDDNLTFSGPTSDTEFRVDHIFEYADSLAP
jgi:prepilin-type processing-associated H-X9-DG protein